jgi:hypothetical protein
VTVPNVPVLVPPAFVNATLRPPLVSWLSLSSFETNVAVTDAPDATVPEDTVTNELEREKLELTVTEGAELVSALPFTTATIVDGVPIISGVNAEE